MYVVKMRKGYAREKVATFAQRGPDGLIIGKKRGSQVLRLIRLVP
jgi:hypothetical protein